MQIRNKRLWAVIGSVVLAVVVTLSLLVATTGTAVARQVNFEASVSGGPPIHNPQTVAGNVHGVTWEWPASQAEGFGQFTWFGFGVDQHAPEGGPMPIPECAQFSPPIGFPGVSGASTLVFEDDSVLFLERGSGQACIDVRDGDVHALNNWKVTGGTGRFRGARGLLTFVGEGFGGEGFVPQGTLKGTLKLKPTQVPDGWAHTEGWGWHPPDWDVPENSR